MNHSLGCELLLEILDRAYEENPVIRTVMNTSMEEIRRSKNVFPNRYFLFVLVLFVVVSIIIYGLLCFTITSQKLKMMFFIIATDNRNIARSS